MSIKIKKKQVGIVNVTSPWVWIMWVDSVINNQGGFEGNLKMSKKNFNCPLTNIITISSYPLPTEGNWTVDDTQVEQYYTKPTRDIVSFLKLLFFSFSFWFETHTHARARVQCGLLGACYWLRREMARFGSTNFLVLVPFHSVLLFFFF